MSRRWFLLGLGLVLLGCDQRLPEDWGIDHRGQSVTTQGRWTVVNYWALWCTPCRREVPALNALVKQHADIAVLGVNFDALQDAALAEAVVAMAIDFPVLTQDPALHRRWARATVLPQSCLVDPKGQLRTCVQGEQSVESLLAQLARLGRS